MKPSVPRLAFFVALFVAHLAVTAVALVKVGAIGIVEGALAGWGSGQITSDLVVAIALVDLWMFVDARRQGRSALVYVILSLPLGSLSPLAYLVKRELRLLAGAQPATAAG
jgi:hypothetical protein